MIYLLNYINTNNYSLFQKSLKAFADKSSIKAQSTENNLAVYTSTTEFLLHYHIF